MMQFVGQSFRDFALGILTSALIFSPLPLVAGPNTDGPLPPRSGPVIELEPLQVDSQVKLLEDRLRTEFDYRGSDEVIRFLRQQADSKVQLSGLREYVFSTHGGPWTVEVEVHPDMVAAVQFANEQLERSGLDFMEYKANVNPHLPPPSEPFAADEKAYSRWRTFRQNFVPLVGFVACLIQAGKDLYLAEAPLSFTNMLPYLSQAFAIVGLEWQFAHFSNMWNYYFWSDTRPGFPPLPERITNRLHERLQGLANLVNQGIILINKGLPKSVHANLLWNIAVNYLYAGTVYSVGMVVASATGNESFSFGFLKMLGASFTATLIFFYGFGLTQIKLGQMSRNFQISEFQRFRFESVASYWGNLGRSLSLIPGLSNVGLIMMGAWGAVVTNMLFLRQAGARKYAERTRQIFEANEKGVSAPPMGKCDWLLETSFRMTRFKGFNGP